MMVRNIQYDYALEWVRSTISASSIQELQQELSSMTYKGQPRLIQERISEFFEDNIKQHISKNPSRGNWQTQQSNIIKIVEKEVVPGNEPRKILFEKYQPAHYDSRTKRVTIKEPKVADFTPIVGILKEERGDFIQPTAIQKRVYDPTHPAKSAIGKLDKFLTNKTPESGEVEVREYKPIYLALDRQLKNAERSGNVKEIELIYNKLQEAATVGLKHDVPQKARKDMANYLRSTNELFQKARTALDKYYENEFQYRSNDDLKQALIRRGVNIIPLTSAQSIRQAAKSAGIGLRKYQRSTDDKIDSIVSIAPRYDKAELQKLDPSKIDAIWKAEKKTTKQKPQFNLYIPQAMFPSKEAEVEKWYQRKIEDTEIRNVMRDVKKTFPFMDSNETIAETYQRLAAKNTPYKLLDREVEKRFMKWRYGKPNKSPSGEDLVDLSRLKLRTFRQRLEREREKVTDPVSKKKVEIVDVIPTNLFTSYQKQLKSKMAKQVEIREKAEESRAAEFEAKATQAAIDKATGGFW